MQLFTSSNESSLSARPHRKGRRISRPFTVFKSPADGAFAQSFPALAHVPCILDCDGSYDVRANAYLIDKSLGRWPKLNEGHGRFPAEKSLRTYADYLANFLTWAYAHYVEVTLCDYWSTLIRGYQADMYEGRWSRTRGPLSPTTINSRVRQACEYLTWMSHKGYRDSFSIPTRDIYIRYGDVLRTSGNLRLHAARRGKLRVSDAPLSLPTKQQTKAWLDQVEGSAGQIFRLMFETILLSGLRREEVACLRRDTLPLNRADWRITKLGEPEHTQHVHIDIMYGAKGPDFGISDGDKIGPRRTIRIPLSLAKKWDEYRKLQRAIALKKAMNRAKHNGLRSDMLRNPVHLFLDERNGQRFTGRHLYFAWLSVPNPIPKWTPHSGRHWWACSTLQQELQKKEELLKIEGINYGTLLLALSGKIINFIIQPQLGHGSAETSQRYIQWAIDEIAVPLSLEDE